VIIFFSSYRRRNGKDQERDLYQGRKNELAQRKWVVWHPPHNKGCEESVL
jgi:hypothetical protein